MTATPFYASAERQARLSLESTRWIGTPFRFGSAVPGEGGGVDCVGLCAALHFACGACEPFELERALPLTWHLHHEFSGILEFLRAPAVRERVRQLDPEDAPMHGDLVAVKTALGVHHLGTWLADALGRHLLHVPINGAAQRWPLDHRALRGRIVGIWRINDRVTP